MNGISHKHMISRPYFAYSSSLKTGRSQVRTHQSRGMSTLKVLKHGKLGVSVESVRKRFLWVMAPQRFQFQYQNIQNSMSPTPIVSCQELEKPFFGSTLRATHRDYDSTGSPGSSSFKFQASSLMTPGPSPDPYQYNILGRLLFFSSVLPTFLFLPSFVGDELYAPKLEPEHTSICNPQNQCSLQ